MDATSLLFEILNQYYETWRLNNNNNNNSSLKHVLFMCVKEPFRIGTALKLYVLHKEAYSIYLKQMPCIGAEGLTLIQ